jgi:hypothetical protein
MGTGEKPASSSTPAISPTSSAGVAAVVAKEAAANAGVERTWIMTRTSSGMFYLREWMRARVRWY